MKRRNSIVFQALGVSAVLGFVLYASFTGLKPSEVKESVDKAVNKYEQFTEDYNEAKEIYYRDYMTDSDNRVEEYSGAEKVNKDKDEDSKKSNIAETYKPGIYHDDNADVKKAEEEQTFIDGKKFEVVIGESCDRIHENTLIMVKMLDEAYGDYSKMNMKKFKKSAEIVKGEYEFVMSAPFPEKHESTQDALRVYGNEIDMLIDDFIDGAKKAKIEEYTELSSKLQVLHNCTGNVFGGYRASVNKGDF